MSTPATEIPRGRMAALRARYREPVAKLKASDTAKAGGLALAMIINSVIALGSTVVFAHLLDDYSALASLISYYLILGVVGQAMQVATAREAVLGTLGVGPELIVTLKRWTRTMVLVTVALTVISVLLRDPIASAVGVSGYKWAAALGIPAGCLWLELSLLRGGLQGVGDYRAVGVSLIGEQGSRLITGALLVAVGLGVTGAYLGTPLSFVIMCAYCAVMLRRAAVGPDRAAMPADAPAHPDVSLWRHVRGALVPIAALIILALLQNIDVIAARHVFGSGTQLANSYAATAVAAKVLLWVAIGAGFYLVPETSRRHHEGQDTRPVLARAVGIIAVCAIPVLGIYAVAAHQLLHAVFKPDQLAAANSLLILGIAFAMLACTYLAIQYLLALKRSRFLAPLAAVAIAEPILLLHAPADPAGFASVVLAVQAVACALAFAMALRAGAQRPAPAAPVTGTGTAGGNAP
jgi:O-antigen/teichoic acid export membrane protein